MHSSVPAGSISNLADTPGTDGMSAWSDREVWMQSEPGWPQIILHVYRRPPGEEGAEDRDHSRRSSYPPPHALEQRLEA